MSESAVRGYINRKYGKVLETLVMAEEAMLRGATEMS